MTIIIYIIIGICGGVLGGLGMGGGTLLIPLLTTFTTLSQHASQTANLIAFLPMSIIVLIIHIKNKLVKFSYLLTISLPAVASSIFTAMLAKNIDSSSLGKYFGIFLIVLGVLQLIGIVVKRISKNNTSK